MNYFKELQASCSSMAADETAILALFYLVHLNKCILEDKKR